MWSNFWKDLHSGHEWRFPEIALWQIHRALGAQVVDSSELVRAKWMWWRRPRAILAEGAFGYILAIAISILLFLIPDIGVFLDAVWLLSCFLLIAFDVVRKVRWRRDYERSVCRMIRTMEGRESM
jgi:hypothetical protein